MIKPRKWVKLGIALAALAFLLPLLALGLSNLFLLSTRGRSFVAKNMLGGLPLETSVAGTTCSPWNGITLHGLRLEQPAPLRPVVARPLLCARIVRIHPDWLLLARKKISVKGVEIADAKLTLPIELLSQIPHKEAVPPVATVNPDPGASPTQQIPAPAPQIIPQVISPPSGPITTVPPAATNPPTTPAAIIPDVKAPTVWLNLKRLSLSIVSGGSPIALCEANGISGSMPLSGKQAKSMITVARIASMGNEVKGQTRIPIAWKSPLLTYGPVESNVFGLDLKALCNVGLVPGIPFKLEALMPEQKEKRILIGKDNKATLGGIMAQGTFQGYLQQPASWQGQSVAQVISVDAELSGGRRAHFERGQALIVFGNGVLRCLDARLIGDDASILANAAILTDGRLAGNARFVAAPDTLGSISKFTRPQNAQPPAFTALSTPQRAALDMQVIGRIGDLLYKPDPASVPIRLR